MPRFRKRVVEIDAEQWFPDRPVEGVVVGKFATWDGEQTQYFDASVPTLEGPHGVTPGDWIVTGIAGEKYPVKPHIFDQLYEPVEQGGG